MVDTTSLEVDSLLLRGNSAGDPHRRRLIVLTPAGVESSRPLPAVWMLPAHGNSSGSFLADDPWKEGLPRRLARLLAGGALAPVRVVLPDLFTRFGGCQTLDSTATGPYERHLFEELLPLFEASFATTAHGLAGHSSGGYGALVQAMRHPDKVRAIACHAGDMLFEYCYLSDFPKATARLQAEGGPTRFMEAFDKAQKKQDGRWFAALNTLAMAAAYSPDPAEELGLALPFDPETAEVREDVWRRWLAHDPVRMIEQPAHRAALAGLELLYLDVGSRDEWNLQWGARALVRRLNSYGVAHVFEEFDDGHTGTAYRFDRSLPLLTRALSAS